MGARTSMNGWVSSLYRYLLMIMNLWRIQVSMTSKECLYCLDNPDERTCVKAGESGVHIELTNNNNKWWISAYSVRTEKVSLCKTNIYCKEFFTESQIKYCPWCGRKL